MALISFRSFRLVLRQAFLGGWRSLSFPLGALYINSKRWKMSLRQTRCVCRNYLKRCLTWPPLTKSALASHLVACSSPARRRNTSVRWSLSLRSRFKFFGRPLKYLMWITQEVSTEKSWAPCWVLWGSITLRRRCREFMMKWMTMGREWYKLTSSSSLCRCKW